MSDPRHHASPPTCPRCGGAFDTDPVCAYCHHGVRFAGRGFAAAPSALACPACASDRMQEVVFRGVSIDVCPDCGGAWLDTGELEHLSQAARAEARDGRYQPTPVDRAPVERERAYIACPRCGSLMNRENWERRSGVLLDTCRLHGIWLDAGELARIRTWAAGTPDGPPPPPAEPVRAPVPVAEPSWLHPAGPDAAEVFSGRGLARFLLGLFG